MKIEKSIAVFLYICSFVGNCCSCAKYVLTLASQATCSLSESFPLCCRECEVFSKNHPAPFSKVITFHKKEPFELEAFYTNLHEVPYPDPRIGNFTIQNVFPQSDGDSSKVKVKVRINIHGIFSVASASVIEKQNLEGDHNDAPMETEASKNEGKEDVVGRKHVSGSSHQGS